MVHSPSLLSISCRITSRALEVNDSCNVYKVTLGKYRPTQHITSGLYFLTERSVCHKWSLQKLPPCNPELWSRLNANVRLGNNVRRVVWDRNLLIGWCLVRETWCAHHFVNDIFKIIILNIIILHYFTVASKEFKGEPLPERSLT